MGSLLVGKIFQCWARNCISLSFSLSSNEAFTALTRACSCSPNDPLALGSPLCASAPSEGTVCFTWLAARLVRSAPSGLVMTPTLVFFLRVIPSSLGLRCLMGMGLPCPWTRIFQPAQEIARCLHQGLHNPVSRGQRFGCYAQIQCPYACWDDNVLCQLDSAGLLVAMGD